MRQRTGSPFTRSTSRSTRARSNATSPNGRADERVPLSPRHHGARALGRCDHRAGSDDRRRGHAAPRGAAARDRQRGHPPDHPDPHLAAHRAHPGPVHPGGERHLACARRVGTAGIHRRRARACSPGVHRRRTHRVVRIHVRGRLGSPLYVENPRSGIWWPPFTALGLVPFALVARWSLALAKAGWAALNVFSLGWSVARARAWTTGWTPVVLALAAVGKPLQSNY